MPDELDDDIEEETTDNKGGSRLVGDNDEGSDTADYIFKQLNDDVKDEDKEDTSGGKK